MSLRVEDVGSEYREQTTLDRVTDYWSVNQDPGQIALSALNSFESIVRAALGASKMARSWRGLRVGAAAMAWNLETMRAGIVVGTNIKPRLSTVA
jgi:hypothetical protein